MATYQVNLTSNLLNMGSEGGLDSSLLNGRSIQRTITDLMVIDSSGNRKKLGRLKDGDLFNNNIDGVNNPGWNTMIDTIWLYPISDVELALQEFKQENSVVELGNKLIFEDSTNLYQFYNLVYSKTELSAGGSGQAYSLGVGTKLEDINSTIHLYLESGLKMVTWRLVKQITLQADLPSGGNSPNNTVGYIAIYCDWDENGMQDPTNLYPGDYGFENGDPLRVGIITQYPWADNIPQIILKSPYS